MVIKSQFFQYHHHFHNCFQQCDVQFFKFDHHFYQNFEYDHHFSNKTEVVYKTKRSH